MKRPWYAFIDIFYVIGAGSSPRLAFLPLIPCYRNSRQGENFIVLLKLSSIEYIKYILNKINTIREVVRCKMIATIRNNKIKNLLGPPNGR